MIEETTVGLMVIKVSHCFSKSGNRIPLTSAGTVGPQLERNSRTRCSAVKSRVGARSGIQRFSCKGPGLRDRNSDAQLAIASGLDIRAPIAPITTADATATAKLTGQEPAIGA